MTSQSGDLSVDPGTCLFRHLCSLREFNYLENPVHLLFLQSFFWQITVTIAIKIFCQRKLPQMLNDSILNSTLSEERIVKIVYSSEVLQPTLVKFLGNYKDISVEEECTNLIILAQSGDKSAI